jgi:hypothetical protein
MPILKRKSRTLTVIIKTDRSGLHGRGASMGSSSRRAACCRRDYR